MANEANGVAEGKKIEDERFSLWNILERDAFN